VALKHWEFSAARTEDLLEHGRRLIYDKLPRDKRGAGNARAQRKLLKEKKKLLAAAGQGSRPVPSRIAYPPLGLRSSCRLHRLYNQSAGEVEWNHASQSVLQLVSFYSS